VNTGKPVLSVLGNHDWYANGREMSQALREIGVETIDNDARIFDGATRMLTRQYSDSCMVFAGVGDLEMDDISFAKALRTTQSKLPRILLSHQPDIAESSELARPEHRVDLIVSGHTHGGQIKLPFLGAPYVPSRFGTKYVEGIVQGPFCPVLISRGVGTSIVPVRFNVPPEVVDLTLVRS
jgi:predicted MPP superfamily phosphohydrolase